MNDELGRRMKGYEQEFTSQKLDSNLPIIVRLDGKNFSKFTKAYPKPFCTVLGYAFASTSEELMRFSDCHLAYTQSDEITLVFLPSPQGLFGGKTSKFNSILASVCTLQFHKRLIHLDKGQNAYFDCRSFNVPDLDEATNVVHWRMLDCVKNSVSVCAQQHFSPKELHGKHTDDMKQMLKFVNADWEFIPYWQKRGFLMRKFYTERAFTQEEIDSLPEKHAVHTNPNLKVVRGDIRRFRVCGTTHEDRRRQFFG